MSEIARIDEHKNGIRLPWNTIPTGIDRPETVTFIPVSSIYTPYAALDELPVLEYSPLECNNCKSVLNPYCPVNHQNKTWRCVMCHKENNLPVNYHSITPHHLPPELIHENTTVEYIPSRDAITAKVTNPHLLQQQQQYQQAVSNTKSPVLIFVIDTALIEEELSALKSTLAQAINTLPEDTQIGFITYGKNVEIHELSSEQFSKSFSIQGGTPQAKVSEYFTSIMKHVKINRIICPLNECVLHLTSILNNIERDPWEVDEVTHRPLRCTGTALHIASLVYRDLLLTHNGRFNARIMLYTGGVCTIGDGATVSINLSKPLRSHVDISRNQLPPQYKISKEYYYQLALQVLGYGISFPYSSCTFDIFACCLDQVGLTEMSSLVQLTNGLIILDDSFSHGVFRGSMKNLFTPVSDPITMQPMLSMAFNGHMSIYTSPHLQMEYDTPLLSILAKHVSPGGGSGGSSAIGGITSKLTSLLSSGNTNTLGNAGLTTGGIVPSATTEKLAASKVTTNLQQLNTKNPYYYLPNLNHGVGCNMQNVPLSKHIQHWNFTSLTPTDSFTTIFTPVKALPSALQQYDKTNGYNCYLQYKTRYIDGFGREVIRVTTVSKPYIQYSKNPEANQHHKAILKSSFDQHTAMAILTRVSVAKSYTTYYRDIIRWVDDILVNLGKMYGNYLAKDVGSFTFSNEFSMVPQYIFYLRRSQLMRIFNSSPDETTFFRLVAQMETTQHILLMIQPQLTKYTVSSATNPIPCALDTTSLDSQAILFLDTYFHVVLWYGQVIAQWKERELHKQAEYAYLADMMRAPLHQAKQCLESRFPTPRFIECIERGSQSRFLTAKLVNATSPAAGSGSDGKDPGYNPYDGGFSQEENLPAIFSDDLPLHDFIKRFQSLAVIPSAKTNEGFTDFNY